MLPLLHKPFVRLHLLGDALGERHGRWKIAVMGSIVPELIAKEYCYNRIL